MGIARRRLPLSRFERYGLLYVWSVFPWMACVLSIGRRATGWVETACVASVILYILTGFGMLASLALRPWLGQIRQKPAKPTAVPAQLWDREIDG